MAREEASLNTREPARGAKSLSVAVYVDVAGLTKLRINAATAAKLLIEEARRQAAAKEYSLFLVVGRRIIGNAYVINVDWVDNHTLRIGVRADTCRSMGLDYLVKWALTTLARALNVELEDVIAHAY
jgi:energy-converting hydrogenase A subunit M